MYIYIYHLIAAFSVLKGLYLENGAFADQVRIGTFDPPLKDYQITNFQKI